MKSRILGKYLKQKSQSPFGRILVLTGARQTGKTTLVKRCFPEYSYISIDDPITRPQYTALSAREWFHNYPSAILDEIQKAPTLVESIKAVYDQYPDAKYILSGSSQILLLKKIRESLAGRVSIIELFPLTIPEILTDSWDDEIKESKMVQWIKNNMNDLELFNGIPLNDDYFVKTKKIFNDYLEFGSMPTIIDENITSEDKYDWLKDYIQTYLQRDLTDLANLNDLEPFIKAQQALAILTGQIINYNNLAKLSGISSKTAKRFVTYLEISYQVIILQPWFKNLNKRLIKSPKIHFLDTGIQKILVGRRGYPTDNEFESTVIAEIYKQIKSFRLNVRVYHLKTFDDKEIDLLLEVESGYIPIEIKMTNKVTSKDARHLKNLDEILDKPIIHSFVLTQDNQVKKFTDSITALPVCWFLS